jgi:hypothetical protein
MNTSARSSTASSSLWPPPAPKPKPTSERGSSSPTSST